MIVARGVEVQGAAAEAGDPGAPLLFDGGRLFSHRGEEPHGIVKERGVGQSRTAGFLSRHGVTGQEAGGLRLVEECSGLLGDCELGAADVGYQLMRSEHWSEPLHRVQDGEDRHAEDNDIKAPKLRVR